MGVALWVLMRAALPQHTMSQIQSFARTFLDPESPATFRCSASLSDFWSVTIDRARRDRNGRDKNHHGAEVFPTGAEWVLRCDPEDIESFQLHVQFDPSEAAPDTTFCPEMGVDLREPFGGCRSFPTGATALLCGAQPPCCLPATWIFSKCVLSRFRLCHRRPVQSPAGVLASPAPPNNNKPLEDILFSVYATGTDFIVTNNAGTRTRYTAAEIGSTTRSVMPGTSPMVWDPDGVNDNGAIGGPGSLEHHPAKLG